MERLEIISAQDYLQGVTSEINDNELISLLSSLAELLANLAPDGLYARALEVAKQDLNRAYRMLHFQRSLASSYALKAELTGSYHFRWEMPILNKIINEGTGCLTISARRFEPLGWRRRKSRRTSGCSHASLP